jgi:hypothetical protein
MGHYTCKSFFGEPEKLHVEPGEPQKLGLSDESQKSISVEPGEPEKLIQSDGSFFGGPEKLKSQKVLVNRIYGTLEFL